MTSLTGLFVVAIECQNRLTDMVIGVYLLKILLSLYLSLSAKSDMPDKDCWLKAIDVELKALEKNQTWTLTDLPTGCKPLGCKWVFKIKRDVLGNIGRYKARLVAQGFAQREGFDYCETYAPVARLETFRILISVTSSKNLFAEQMDVENASLQGNLSETIFMKLPEGCTGK